MATTTPGTPDRLLDLIKHSARQFVRHPHNDFHYGAVDFARAAGHQPPCTDYGNGMKGYSADEESFRIHRAGISRAKAVAERYRRFCHYMRETRHGWTQDAASRTFYADNSVEIDEVSQLTGERRRKTLVAPHGDPF